MSGGIRTSVKGYIKAKRVTLTLETIALQTENENETVHSSLPQAAECADTPEASVASNALSIISRIPRLTMASFAVCFKGTMDHEGIKIASGLYSPSTFQKVVFKVDIQNELMRTVLLKMLARMDGVNSVSLDMKEKKVILTGELMDAVYMACKLRKNCGYATIVSVTGSETRTVKPVNVIETVEALSETTTVESVEEEKKDEGRKVSDGVIINPKKGAISRSASI